MSNDKTATGAKLKTSFDILPCTTMHLGNTGRKACSKPDRTCLIPERVSNINPLMLDSPLYTMDMFYYH